MKNWMRIQSYVHKSIYNQVLSSSDCKTILLHLTFIHFSIQNVSHTFEYYLLHHYMWHVSNQQEITKWKDDRDTHTNLIDLFLSYFKCYYSEHPIFEINIPFKDWTFVSLCKLKQTVVSLTCSIPSRNKFFFKISQMGRP